VVIHIIPAAKKRKKQCTDLIQLFLCGYAACYSRDNVRYTWPITGKIKDTYFSSSNATHLWRHKWQNMLEKLSKRSRNQTLLLQQWGSGRGQKNEQYMSYTRQKKENCHSALTPQHEIVHKGEVRLHAFLALSFERGEGCHLLVLKQNVIHLLLTKIKKM